MFYQLHKLQVLATGKLYVLVLTSFFDIDKPLDGLISPLTNPSRQVAKSVTSPLMDSEMGVVFVGDQTCFRGFSQAFWAPLAGPSRHLASGEMGSDWLILGEMGSDWRQSSFGVEKPCTGKFSSRTPASWTEFRTAASSSKSARRAKSNNFSSKGLIFGKSGPD